MSGSLGDMGSLLKQAQEMQRELDRVRGELAEREVEGTAGGRAVVVTLTCAKEVRSVTFSDEFVAQAEKDDLEEMTLLAVRDAVAQAEQISKDELAQVTGGLNLPGLM